MKRYLCIGGTVSSRYDGERHYVSPRRLAQLCGVHPAECVMAHNSRDPILWGADRTRYVVLRPRYDGNYRGWKR